MLASHSLNPPWKVSSEFTDSCSNIFGVPSTTEPWGFNYFGHHLCLSITFIGPQMTISPTFFGAEPDVIDEGIHKGLTLFRDEEIDGLRLMQDLVPDMQKKAQLYPDVRFAFLPSFQAGSHRSNVN